MQFHSSILALALTTMPLVAAQPVSAPVAPSAAPSGSSLPSFFPSFFVTLPPDLQPDTNYRCGVDTLDAYGNCGNECSTQADCAEGEFCWGTFLNYCRIMPEGHPKCELRNGEQTKLRCGYDEVSARGYCGNECTDITQCGPAEFCFPVQLNFCDCFEAQDANATATAGRSLLAGPDGTMTNAEYFDEAVLVISPYYIDAASGSSGEGSGGGASGSGGGASGSGGGASGSGASAQVVGVVASLLVVAAATIL